MKWIFYIAKTLLSLLFLASASMYFFNYEGVSAIFTELGFPIWLVYPMATAKVLGVLAIWIPLPLTTFREWAYAGFFFDASLAVAAHTAVDQGAVIGILALFLILLSYSLEKRLAQKT